MRSEKVDLVGRVVCRALSQTPTHSNPPLFAGKSCTDRTLSRNLCAAARLAAAKAPVISATGGKARLLLELEDQG